MKTTKSLFRILTISLALTVQAQAQSFLTNGLVAYYPFNGNANDATGNGNNGTVYGATLTQNRFGVSNSAYAFNGTTSYIEIPDFPQADANTHSISVWIQANSWTNNPANESPFFVDMIDKYTTGEQRQWCFQGDPTGQFRSAIFTSTGQYTFNSIAVLQTNQWYQLVQLWDGTNSSIFINGELDSRIPAPGTLVPSSAPIRIGGNLADSQQMFCGNINDVRIYDVALSSNEVQQLYQYEFAPQVGILQAVVPTFSNLYIGTNYQLQISTNLSGTFTNYGSTFAATNSTMIYPQYFNVANRNQLFFRLVAP